jgi:hypothetical protein
MDHALRFRQRPLQPWVDLLQRLHSRTHAARSGAVDAFHPACQDRAMPSPDAAQNGRRTLAALAVLAVVALLRWHTALFDDRLAVDESDYTGAFANVAAGGDPYAIPRFLYPPPFARAGATAEGLLGERGVVLALRIANLAGAIAIVWISLGWSGLAWRLRLGIASLLLVAWAPVHQGIESGNVSLAVLGLTLAAVALLPGRALAAGAMLGLGLAIKPLVPALVALLPAWRPLPPRRAGWVAAASAAVTLGVSLLWGLDLLPRMLAKTTGPLPHGHTVSLWRLLHCLGIEARPLVLLGAAIAVGVPLLLARPRSRSGFAVLAGTAAIYASPLVWTHTLALTLPAQVLALERSAQAWRSAAPGSSQRARAFLLLAVLTALALAIQGSEALVAINDRPLLVQALFLVPPVLAPALFAWVALRRDPGAPEAVPFENGATVGQ